MNFSHFSSVFNRFFFVFRSQRMPKVLIGVFESMSFFFVRFLVFELLSILYFPLLNSDLGLRRLAGKQRSVVLLDMPLTLTYSN